MKTSLLKKVRSALIIHKRELATYEFVRKNIIRSEDVYHLISCKKLLEQSKFYLPEEKHKSLQELLDYTRRCMSFKGEHMLERNILESDYA